MNTSELFGSALGGLYAQQEAQLRADDARRQSIDAQQQFNNAMRQQYQSASYMSNEYMQNVSNRRGAELQQAWRAAHQQGQSSAADWWQEQFIELQEWKREQEK